MPQATSDTIITALRALIITLVVAWVVNLHGRLGLGLFNEQMLAAVLGTALALCFFQFPLSRKEVGEEAVAKVALEGRKGDAPVGWIDVTLAAAAVTAAGNITRNVVPRPCCVVTRTWPRWSWPSCSPGTG